MKLALLSGEYSVCGLPAGSAVLVPPGPAELYGVIVTVDEVSVVCAAGEEPEGAKVESGWSALRVVGQLDFSLVGILSALTAPLAEAGVSVFALSTFDTDYLLVRTADLPRAVEALRARGYTI
ncbi:ACT domain-containing protein [Rhizohabitans arisaemae]|uniref:ACT domain-containing protein n=1 Tax=Rhizohabitans arisaemae TaxID=2720610 RepID=UPI003D161137